MARRTWGTATGGHLVLAGVAALALGAAGCTDRSTGPTPTSSVAPMWRAYFGQALADPGLTDFESQVLSDYRVTGAEYAEARSRYRGCMADRGWIVSDQARGDGYQFAVAPGSGNETRTPMSDSDECAGGSTRYVEPIFIGMRDNPRGIPRVQQIRDCYRSRGVPDGADLSDDEFESLISTEEYHASTPEGKLCFWDPMGLLGLTVEDAEAMDASSEVLTATQGS